MKTLCVQVALLALLAGACLSSALSIENEQPVKVTHRNSGPRYDIDDSLERTRALVKEALASSPSPPPAAAPGVERPAPEAGQDENAPAVGHIALRRIFLIPIMRPQGDEHPLDQAAGSQSGREQEDSGEQSPRVPMMMAKPLWPFMMPARPTPGQAGHPDGDQPEGHDERPHIMRHLFGADQASRSPDMERAAAERDESQQVGPQQPHAFDPIQMMMDMMHQAISSQLGRDFAKNLNSDSSSNNNNKETENTPAAESSNERPTMPQVLSMKPGSQNETREDIVEIEGRKYVRKTLINRHVGDNLVFMTRRLIFIPLNETEAGEPTEKATTTSTTTTTTELPPSSSQTPPQEAANEASERPSPPVVLNRAGSEDAKPSEAPQTPSTSAPSTTTSTEQPSSVKPAEEQTTLASSTSKPEESTTVSSTTEAAQRDASPKAAERLVEASSESPKPAEKETPKSSP